MAKPCQFIYEVLDKYPLESHGNAIQQPSSTIYCQESTKLSFISRFRVICVTSFMPHDFKILNDCDFCQFRIFGYLDNRLTLLRVT